MTYPLPKANGYATSSHILHGKAVAFSEINIDTDAIFPKQFLTTVKRTGLSHALFADWRFGSDGKPLSSFVLNKPGFEEVEFLIGGDNFGCGSSREHAVWALKDYGVRAVISSSFGSFFQNNCINNAIWPLQINKQDLQFLTAWALKEKPVSITLDLKARLIFPGDGTAVRAHIAETDHYKLMHNQDDIAQTLENIDAIEAFEMQYSASFPWTG